MKNLNKKIKYFIMLFWLGISCSILEADVVITEVFILRADGTHTPQYIELYNNSPSLIDLENWSIITLDDGDTIAFFPDKGNSLSIYSLIDNEINTKIDAFDYFLISGSIGLDPGLEFDNQQKSDIDALYWYLPLDGMVSIVLKNDINNTIDSVGYNIDEYWTDNEEDNKGRSLRLHSPELDNSLSENWSLSPKTERSIWLFDAGEEIKNFGSPQEENSFTLFEIQYSDSWFPDTSYANGGTHFIYGDFNNFYRAEPYKDFGVDKLPDTGDEGESNGIWDLDEEYHDRNLNNIWDYQDNNYNLPLVFSWVGTFIDTTVIDTPEISYEIIIEKNNTQIYNSSLFDSLGTEISILPLDLLINSIGQGREIAEYTWTVELTKEFSNDSTDTIYSDKYTFFIDASDYGRYGCVDNGSCADDANCPTNAHYESSYISNHPIGCVPGDDISSGGCYSALNYYEDANINSNTCHYASLSIPAFVVGDANTVAAVPIYFTNDSLAEIDEIEFVLNFDNSSSRILSYDGGTFFGTVISELNVGEIISDTINGNGNISVNIPISSVESSFSWAGIITYLDFDLVGEKGSYTDLSLTAATVKGGFPENDISVPVKEGEIAILQTNYLQTNYIIAGQVKYYSPFSPEDEPEDIPNVILSLSQQYNGDNVPDTLISITTADSSFKFEGLTVGNYNLSFSKSPELDCDDNGVNGWDLTAIENHLKGIEPLDADQSIAADVSLDGTVSGYDISLIAQYSVDLIDNFSDIETHWIFKPRDTNPEDSLNVHSELLKHNGTYSIDYKPLVLDDDKRQISAYRLGDVNASYCRPSTSNRMQVQFTDVAIDYMPIITLPIIISEPTSIEGLDIEIGYDEDIFNPLSIIINNSNKVAKNYKTVSNLTSKNRTIKTVTWVIEEPQIVEGKIGEVSFHWINNNKSGKIWLKEFQINDEPAVGGLSVIGLSDSDAIDGVNIINSLVPKELSLHQNYPNPFNPQTTIKWSMPLPSIVSLEVYNLQGQLVELLINGQLEAGIHEQTWDATTYPSGIYFYRMTTNKKTLQKVMLLLK